MKYNPRFSTRSEALRRTIGSGLHVRSLCLTPKAMEKRVRFLNRSAFRKWLKNNFQQKESIWIEFYKDGRKGISYQESLEEALCFGWIDSLIKKVDEAVYLRKFSKRRKESKWSENNKKLVGRLLEDGVVGQAGIDAIEEAKRNGMWNRKDEREEYVDIDGLRKLLKARLKDMKEFDNLSESLKRHYSMVYFSAKTKETRNRRLDIVIQYMKTKKRFM